jgi:hypothetical protein
MVLKIVEKDGKTKAIYSSTNICASTYDNTSGDLTLIFTNGGQYKYTSVSKADYMRFEMADSQGSVMNTHIKKYPTTKLDKIDTAMILKEVKELSEANKPTLSPEAATKEMLSTMTDIISNHFKNGNITAASLLVLKNKITQFEEVTKKQPVLAD